MGRIAASLREFLKILDSEKLLVHIKDEVDPEPDIGAAGRAAAKRNRLYFLRE